MSNPLSLDTSLDAPVKYPTAGNDALHSGDTQFTALATPDAGNALPTVSIDHDRKGIADIGPDHPLNNGASPDSLIQWGIFGSKGDNANLDTAHSDKLRTDQDKVNKVSVAAGDTNTQGANFIVGADGKITVVNNPDNSKDSALKVVLEKTSSGESEAQKKAADALVGYLKTRYGVDGVGIEDPDKLVSDSLKTPNPVGSPAVTPSQQAAAAAAWGRGLGTDNTQNTSGDVPPPPSPGGYSLSGGNPGMGGGNPYRGGGQAEYPQTTNPHRQYGGYGGGLGFSSPETSGMGLTSPEQSYDFSGQLLMDWLMGQLNISDPKDIPKALAALEKTDHVAADRLRQVADVASKLQSGQQVGAGDMQKAIPQELAQKISQQEVDKFSKLVQGPDGKVDAGDLALALKLGHVATATEKADPANQKLMEEARNPDANTALLKAAESTNGQPLWEGTGAPSNLGCAVTVSKWCQDAGYRDINAANTPELERQLRAHGAVDIDPAHAKKGDIVMFDSNGEGHGHTALYSGDGRAWANSSRDGVVENNTIASMAAGRSYHFLRLPNHHSTDDIATTSHTSDKAA